MAARIRTLKCWTRTAENLCDEVYPPSWRSNSPLPCPQGTRRSRPKIDFDSYLPNAVNAGRDDGANDGETEVLRAENPRGDGADQRLPGDLLQVPEKTAMVLSRCWGAGASDERKNMIPSLRFHCDNNHWWPSIVPGYWFAIPLCPECESPATSIKWGGLQESHREYRLPETGYPDPKNLREANESPEVTPPVSGLTEPPLAV